MVTLYDLSKPFADETAKHGYIHLVSYQLSI